MIVKSDTEVSEVDCRIESLKLRIDGSWITIADRAEADNVIIIYIIIVKIIIGFFLGGIRGKFFGLLFHFSPLFSLVRCPYAVLPTRLEPEPRCVDRPFPDSSSVTRTRAAASKRHGQPVNDAAGVAEEKRKVRRVLHRSEWTSEPGPLTGKHLFVRSSPQDYA